MFKAKLVNYAVYDKLIKVSFLSLVLMLVWNTAAQFVFSSNLKLQITAQIISGLITPLVIVLLTWDTKIFKSKEQQPFSGKVLCDPESIQIMKKRGEVIFNFNLNDVDQLILKDNYKLNESENFFRRMIGKKTLEKDKNFLIIKSHSEEARLDFFIDSLYMLGRLEKVQQSWLDKGYKLSYITT